MKPINESSLSRVWRHFNDPEKNVAILTAFRGENTYDENVALNKSLAASLRKQGYGFFYVDGYWIENQGTENERAVSEDSIFVIAPKSDRNFADIIHKFGNQYNQDAVLVKDLKGTRIINRDGSVYSLGEIQPGQLGSMYTKLRNNKKSNTFVFESERDDIGFIARLAGIRS